MKKLVALLLVAGLAGKTNAQDKKVLLSGEFNNLKLEQCFEAIEKQGPYYFYYDAAQLDTNRVSLSFSQQTISQVLTSLFRNTAMVFAIDAENKVYVTRNIRVVTDLPQGLFSPVTNTVAARDTLADYGLQARKGRTVSPNKLYEIGTRSNNTSGNAIVTGYIYNARSGEPLVNASVFINSSTATVTDAYGYYSLMLPLGKHVMNIVAIGMKDTKLQVQVHSDGKLDVDLPEQVTTLKEVTVSSRKTSNITKVQMGSERLNIENIRRVPTLFGESDVLRVITSLPGVKTVGEASTGFNVRGGSADQNLILFNDANIFNPSHFFGMFSAFNPEVIKEIELYKSSIPARFGGRLASVLDISSREGNKKQFTGSAGIGVITSRLTLEGPIVKDKTSFILGARTTYANWLLKLLPDDYRNSKADFQDLNIGISHRIDTNNTIYATAYYSRDAFALRSDTTYGYSNRNATIKWKKNFNSKLSAVFVLGGDEYTYKVYSDANKTNAYDLSFGINQLHAQANFNYYRNLKHAFDFGLSTIRYKLHPGKFAPRGSESQVALFQVEDEQALESGIYFTHRYNPDNKLSFSTGIRFSLFNYLGPQEVNTYAEGLPYTPDNMVGVETYGKGKFIKNYGGPEVRFSVRYALTSTFSVKAGFNSQRQYIHMLSNTTAIAPTDIWKLSDPNIQPQTGSQVSLGFYKNLKSNTIETSIEVYYKRINHYLDYKPGAMLLLNPDIEQDVITTRGKAYGAELLIKKPGGKLNGWISYTYSRILLQSDDKDLGNLVNNGDFYPANYDKPHDVTLTGIFRVNHRFSFSLNSTYSTGRPITLPVGRYYYGGSVRVLYSDRNAYRIPDYIRSDFSMNIEGNHKVHQKTHNSWTIGLYNLLGRKNPYSVYFISENGVVNGYKLSIFGSVIPFVNFNIRF